MYYPPLEAGVLFISQWKPVNRAMVDGAISRNAHREPGSTNMPVSTERRGTYLLLFYFVTTSSARDEGVLHVV
jgi:hypothetical protein